MHSFSLRKKDRLSTCLFCFYFNFLIIVYGERGIQKARVWRSKSKACRYKPLEYAKQQTAPDIAAKLKSYQSPRKKQKRYNALFSFRD
jgi:hypothetical protein